LKLGDPLVDPDEELRLPLLERLRRVLPFLVLRERKTWDDKQKRSHYNGKQCSFHAMSPFSVDAAPVS
jgi:hypothetical protein